MRALIVVDYQNDFVIGTLGSSYTKAIEENIVSKIKQHLKKGHDVFFTFDTHDIDYHDTDEGKRIPTEHCIKGTKGWELHGKVAEYRTKGKTIEKRTFGTFDIIGPLKGYEEIEICGVVTNICVTAIAIILKTAYPETKIVIDPDAVASYDPELHRKALDVLASLSIDIEQIGPNK